MEVNKPKNEKPYGAKAIWGKQESSFSKIIEKNDDVAICGKVTSRQRLVNREQ